MQIQTYERD